MSALYLEQPVNSSGNEVFFVLINHLTVSHIMTHIKSHIMLIIYLLRNKLKKVTMIANFY